jgi:hypothetical protein
MGDKCIIHVLELAWTGYEVVCYMKEQVRTKNSHELHKSDKKYKIQKVADGPLDSEGCRRTLGLRRLQKDPWTY